MDQKRRGAAQAVEADAQSPASDTTDAQPPRHAVSALTTPFSHLRMHRQARGTSSLPTFSMESFMTDVAAGAQQEAMRLEEEERAEKVRLAEKRAERERRTAMFTTPGRVPLAMAPPIDWKLFQKHALKSDLLFMKLYPDHPEHRCRAKNLRGEIEVILIYLRFLSERREDADEEASRKEFYDTLYLEVDQDMRTATIEYSALIYDGVAQPLGLFEFHALSQKGDTDELESRLETGDWLAFEDHDAVQQKYGHILRKYPKLWRFEKRYQTQIAEGGHIYGPVHAYGEEVRAKYGHLLEGQDESSEAVDEEEKNQDETVSDACGGREAGNEARSGNALSDN